MNPQLEIRTFKGLEVRKAATDSHIGTLVGYAAVWDSESRDFGGWKEVLKPGVFTRSMKEKPDVFAFYQHDAEKVLARAGAGTLRLEEDTRGLKVEMDLIDTQLNRDVLAQVRSGNVDSMSFGMRGAKSAWSKKGAYTLRSVTEAELVEVSIVTIPAYEATEIAARAFQDFRKETSAVPLDLLKVCVEVEKLR